MTSTPMKPFPPERLDTNRIIEDGFGNSWRRCARKDCDLQVVRPGKVQCSCEGAQGLGPSGEPT
jgi:hypothetical protein